MGTAPGGRGDGGDMFLEETCFLEETMLETCSREETRFQEETVVGDMFWRRRWLETCSGGDGV